MKVFSFGDIDEAVEYAMKGGEAVHLHSVVFNDSPRCFIQAVVQRKEPIAHLFDQNLARLKQTARNHGIKVVYIDGGIGTKHQHIDFCGGPMKLLITNHIDRMKFAGKIKQADSLIRHLEEDYPGTKKWRLRG